MVEKEKLEKIRNKLLDAKSIIYNTAVAIRDYKRGDKLEAIKMIEDYISVLVQPVEKRIILHVDHEKVLEIVENEIRFVDFEDFLLATNELLHNALSMLDEVVEELEKQEEQH